MKAAVLVAPRRLEVRDIPRWTIDPDMVLVRVKACGVCGSDLRYFDGENPWALHTLGRAVPNEPNIVLGHEFAGEVVEAGSSRFEHLVGKRVGALCFVTCGECAFCLAGRENLCPRTVHIGHGAGWGRRDYYPGAMAEYCLLWARQCRVLPDSMSWEEAALLDPLQVGVHAVGLSGLRPGGSAVVLGAGPVGLSAAMVARASGARFTAVTDVYEAPLAIARCAGVTLALDARNADPVAALLGANGGAGVDTVVDTVGTRDSLRQGLALLAPGGTFVNLAVHPGETAFDTLALGSERVLRTSSNSLFRDYQVALDLTASGQVKTAAMVTHRFPLDRVNEAFDVLFDKERTGAVKAVILP
jgi:threonine dehydrogenase-like Zn-dependent dehydrogenase